MKNYTCLEIAILNGLVFQLLKEKGVTDDVHCTPITQGQPKTLFQYHICFCSIARHFYEMQHSIIHAQTPCLSTQIMLSGLKQMKQSPR